MSTIKQKGREEKFTLFYAFVLLLRLFLFYILHLG